MENIFDPQKDAVIDAPPHVAPFFHKIKKTINNNKKGTIGHDETKDPVVSFCSKTEEIIKNYDRFSVFLLVMGLLMSVAAIGMFIFIGVGDKLGLKNFVIPTMTRLALWIVVALIADITFLLFAVTKKATCKTRKSTNLLKNFIEGHASPSNTDHDSVVAKSKAAKANTEEFGIHKIEECFNEFRHTLEHFYEKFNEYDRNLNVCLGMCGSANRARIIDYAMAETICIKTMETEVYSVIASLKALNQSATILELEQFRSRLKDFVEKSCKETTRVTNKYKPYLQDSVVEVKNKSKPDFEGPWYVALRDEFESWNRDLSKYRSVYKPFFDKWNPGNMHYGRLVYYKGLLASASYRLCTCYSRVNPVKEGKIQAENLVVKNKNGTFGSTDDFGIVHVDENTKQVAEMIQTSMSYVAKVKSLFYRVFQVELDGELLCKVPPIDKYSIQICKSIDLFCEQSTELTRRCYASLDGQYGCGGTADETVRAIMCYKRECISHYNDVVTKCKVPVQFIADYLIKDNRAELEYCQKEVYRSALLVCIVSISLAIGGSIIFFLNSKIFTSDIIIPKLSTGFGSISFNIGVVAAGFFINFIIAIAVICISRKTNCEEIAPIMDYEVDSIEWPVNEGSPNSYLEATTSPERVDNVKQRVSCW